MPVTICQDIFYNTKMCNATELYLIFLRSLISTPWECCSSATPGKKHTSAFHCSCHDMHGKSLALKMLLADPSKRIGIPSTTTRVPPGPPTFLICSTRNFIEKTRMEVGSPCRKTIPFLRELLSLFRGEKTTTELWHSARSFSKAARKSRRQPGRPQRSWRKHFRDSGSQVSFPATQNHWTNDNQKDILQRWGWVELCAHLHYLFYLTYLLQVLN